MRVKVTRATLAFHLATLLCERGIVTDPRPVGNRPIPNPKGDLPFIPDLLPGVRPLNMPEVWKVIEEYLERKKGVWAQQPA